MLLETQMLRLLGNTLVLSVGVVAGVVLLGVSLAWLTSLCEFPGRRWLDWALMLPFAVPAYVLAFVMIGLLDFAGPLQSLLRSWLGNDFRMFSIRSTGGVIFVLVLVFYPYVYMLARGAFLAQGRGLMEAARILGHSPWHAFWRVALPMARPAIGAGAALAVMEVHLWPMPRDGTRTMVRRLLTSTWAVRRRKCATRRRDLHFCGTKALFDQS